MSILNILRNETSLPSFRMASGIVGFRRLYKRCLASVDILVILHYLLLATIPLQFHIYFSSKYRYGHSDVTFPIEFHAHEPSGVAQQLMTIDDHRWVMCHHCRCSVTPKLLDSLRWSDVLAVKLAARPCSLNSHCAPWSYEKTVASMRP